MVTRAMSAEIAQAIRDSYDRVAEEYARRIYAELQSKPLDCELLDRFARETAGRGDVCDMGCGPGQVARYLRDKGATVFGLDLSPGMLDQARRLNPDIDFWEGNMLALGLGDATLAGIAAFYAIVNIPAESLPQAFREMARVLQPGGLLLLAFHMGGEAPEVNELWGRPIYELLPLPAGVDRPNASGCRSRNRRHYRARTVRPRGGAPEQKGLHLCA
jgi:SAM-dependent methyltransferase